MSSKETLTSFMDMLGFKEISYAFEFIAENNFSESQITALVREFTKPAIELIECKVCGKSLDVIEFLTSNYPNTCRNCVNKALGINSGKTAFPYWMKGSLICDICKVGYTVLIMKQNNKQVCHNCDTNKKFTYDPIKEKKEKEAKNHEK